MSIMRGIVVFILGLCAGLQICLIFSDDHQNREFHAKMQKFCNEDATLCYDGMYPHHKKAPASLIVYTTDGTDPSIHGDFCFTPCTQTLPAHAELITLEIALPKDPDDEAK